MTVEQFEKEFKELQDEGTKLYAELKPLFARLKKLAAKGIRLGAKADYDKKLYVVDPTRKHDSALQPDGWDINILFRLQELDYPLEAIEGVTNVLGNLKASKFRKRKGK